MKRSRCRMVLLALICVAAGTRADTPQKALDALRGTWDVVTKSQADFEVRQLIFEGDTFTAVLREQDRKMVQFKIDPAQKPMHIDMDAGKEKHVGIYELKGDTLRLCFAITGTTRPSEFKAADGIILVTLKRAK